MRVLEEVGLTKVEGERCDIRYMYVFLQNMSRLGDPCGQ